MGKGVYLKEHGPHEKAVAGRRERRNGSGAKRKRMKHRLHRFGLGLAAVLMILLIVLVGAIFDDPLIGRWYMDEVTSYQFSGNGKGVMILPAAQYDFTYVIDGNILNIDFAYEGAKDAQYTFNVNGGVLTLDGGNPTTQGTYALTRSK